MSQTCVRGHQRVDARRVCAPERQPDNCKYYIVHVYIILCIDDVTFNTVKLYLGCPTCIGAGRLFLVPYPLFLMDEAEINKYTRMHMTRIYM